MPGTTRQSLPGASRYSRADSCLISTYRFVGAAMMTTGVASERPSGRGEARRPD
jgi:hypothetical protein